MQLTRLRGAWSGIPARAQYAIIGVAVVTILIMFLVLRAATSTEWTVAASDLSNDKLGEAQTVLQEAGIENRVSATGAAIEVPVADLPKAANALVPAGIAAKGSRTGCAQQSEEGSSMMAQTSAQHALMIQTCSENDAANTIEGLDGIEKATVDVTAPGESLFSSEQETPTAAVTIDTGGQGLPRKTAKGIQQIVAQQFEGMRVTDVSIVDETGTVVTGDGGDSGEESRMEKLNAESVMNKKIERDLTATFESIVGANNIVVASNIELDMDKIDRGVINNAAAGEDGEPLVEVEDFTKELLNGNADTGVQGVVGTPTNISVDPADRRTVTPDLNGERSAQSDYVSDAGKITYANNKVEEAIKVAPGTVIRNRMTVTVDDDVDPAAANAVKDSIQAWMGGNAQDSLAFSQAPLALAATPTEVTGATRTSAIADYLKWGLLGIGLIGLAFVLRRTLTQRTAELLAPADDLLLLDSGDFTPIPIAELEAALAANQPSAERRGRLEMQRKVEQIAESKPNDVANELRRWMHHDEPGYAPVRKAG
jgi:flagellar biosynthesis/type III secretory pathway M-ring protein FliF/YscJ